MGKGLCSALCALVAAERLLELRRSRAHARRQAARGGELVREPVFPAMALLHGAVLVAAPVESWARGRRPPVLLTAAALVALGGATALRAWTLRTLGDAWSVRITRFPAGRRPIVTSGPYRRIKHPNYLAVIVELLALPLVGGAYWTAALGSLANAAVLARRIPLEERELQRDERWRRAMAHKPRFVAWPWARPRW